MAITTVGLALEFAGKLEDQVKRFYQQVVDSTDNGPIKEQVVVLMKISDKRQVALRRLYEDNVYSDMDTGVLAPIESMERKHYTLPLLPDQSTIDGGLLKRITEYEKALERFYINLSGRLQSGPRSIWRRIDKMAQEIGEQIGVLETIGHLPK